MNANDIFGSTLISAENISYDNMTGVVTVLEPGGYKFTDNKEAGRKFSRRSSNF